jgi:Domain of unknown function (DUF4287)
MSFQGYLKTILDKTGKTAEEFYKLAEEKGLTADAVKPGQIVTWLKQEHNLGHGHAMALVRAFKFLKRGEELLKD